MNADLDLPSLQALADDADRALVALQRVRSQVRHLQRQARASARGQGMTVAADEDGLRWRGLTVAQTAVLLGVGEEQVRRLLRTGKLLGVPFGGKAGWRLDPDYVADLARSWTQQRANQAAVRTAQRAG